MTEKTTANDVLRAIFAKHEGPEWVRFAEVADSTGTHSRRRADAICMNIWPSKGFAIHGFEVKVSRSDFMHEMKDITKAEAVGQFCDFWWLAAPVGMVRVDEVPESWGLMELQKNGLKVKKQAPRRENPSDITRGFMASLLRRGRDRDDAYIQAQIDAGEEKRVAEMKREIESRTERTAKKAEDNAKWIAEFEEKLGIPFQQFEAPERMAERLAVARSLEFGHMSRLMVACAGVVQEVGALGKAMPDGRDTQDAIG